MTHAQGEQGLKHWRKAMMSGIQVIGVGGMPEIKTGDDVASLIVEAMDRQGVPTEQGDILVVTQKIVSKAEGRVLKLEDIQASPIALQLSEGHNRDPRHTEVILLESRRIVRMDRGNIISETRHGFTCANAGVDASNIPGEGTVALLPVDPDASAEGIQAGIKEKTGKDVAVIISDTFGRPWREGAMNVAIGVSGMNPMQDYRGLEDAYGQLMRSTVIAVADELAATAELVTGKVTGVPVALIRGYKYETTSPPDQPRGAQALVRSSARDMFR